VGRERAQVLKELTRLQNTQNEDGNASQEDETENSLEEFIPTYLITKKASNSQSS